MCWSLLAASVFFFAGLAPASPDPELFPRYRSILANIEFWKKVYSTYSVNTAIIHDQEHLERIYATVPLVDKSLPQARRENDIRIERAKDSFRKTLNDLARGRRTGSVEEKKVLSLFGTAPASAELERAAGNIRAQTGLKEQFLEGVIRSGAYMDEIRRIFRSRGLPEDLAYLPHVESSFNPRAFSRFGAAGMWQFTHATGKEFLRIDYIVDERRDPLISAEAAAAFLQRNYRELNSWPLALTAYNYGPAGMKRALDQEGGYEQIFNNYRTGYFKFASRNFYAEFLAAVDVAKALEQTSGLRLDRPLSFVTVRLPAFTDSSRLAAYLRLDTQVLRRYNPALREPVFEGTKYIPKDYALRLPPHYRGSRLLTSIPSSVFSREQKRSQFYQVRAGDTAGAIARAHKVPLTHLIAANNLDERVLIRVGQNLRIPPQAADSGTLQSSSPTLRDSKKTAPAAADLPIGDNAAVVGNLKVFDVTSRNNLVSGRIEVQPDESIGMVADWLRATSRSINIANQRPPGSDLFPGQIVTLDFINVSVESFEAARFDFHQEIQEDFFNSYSIVGLRTYRVKSGDTLWDICYKKFDIPLWLLRKYNHDLDFKRLSPASDLQIPILKEI